MGSTSRSLGELLCIMPFDIQRCIFDFLPLYSTAALSMMCRALREACANANSGTHALAHGDEIQKRAFLRLLEVDQPQMRACYTCIRLHPVSEQDHPRTYNSGMSCTCGDVASWQALWLADASSSEPPSPHNKTKSPTHIARRFKTPLLEFVAKKILFQI